MKTPKHPFDLQWDSHFYRDMTRLRRIRADEAGHRCLDDAMSLAELYVKMLHAYFNKPISAIEWHDGIVVMRLRMPKDVTADIALHSFGRGHYKVCNPTGYDDVTCPNAEVLVNTLLNDLVSYGLLVRNLPRRANQRRTTRPSNHQPRVPASNVLVRGDEKRSATVSRTTVRYDSEKDDAFFDRANAEIPQTADDARIVRFKLIADSGITITINGLRQAISPTAGHSVNSNCVTVATKTMNPNATLAIDPPDCAPKRRGHQVMLPDGEDTTITVTATAADGVTKSSHEFTARRQG